MIAFMNREALWSLAEYDAYANQLLLDTVAQLTAEEFDREASPSHHSVHRLLRHMLESEWFFLALCCNRSLPRLPGGLGLPEIRAQFDAVAEETATWLASIPDDELRCVIPFPQPLMERTMAFAKWQFLLQNFMHCAQHRSELSVVLTSLGHPLPNLDIILQWIEQSDAQRRFI